MRDSFRYTPRRRWLRPLAVAASLAIVAAACGGGGGGGGGAKGAQGGVPKSEGKPVPGGSVTYGLEAETLGGFCPPTAQLAAGGIQVFQAFYDTLAIPNDKLEYVPNLAKSIDHNTDYTQWTITLRPNIKFHNGEAFNADAVVQNLNAFRKGILFGIVFKDITDVSKVDDLTLKITMGRPWVAFPAFLWSTGRLGMAAPEQLNSDSETCKNRIIGTGPFTCNGGSGGCWTPNDRLVGTKNPSYWQKDKDGNPLPYLDQITFRPIPDVSQRVNGLKSGDLDVMHLSAGTSGRQIADLRQDAQAGTINLLESDRAAEISHTMLNAGKPPFNNVHARLAVAYATNTEELNRTFNRGIAKLAGQPFAPETLGYQKNVDWPKYDPGKAKKEIEAYKKDTGASELRFTLDTTPDPETQDLAAAAISGLEQVGVKVDLKPPTEQTQYINVAIGGDYNAILWRNFPGGDSDTLYVWWYGPGCGANAAPGCNYINFGRINDPQINKDLDQGRSETDPAKRKAAYQDIGAQFAKNAYNIWTWYTLWAFPSQKSVHGLIGPRLPNGDERGLPIASVQPVVGIWKSK